MHAPYVRWIIYQLCFRTWWVKHPFSCAEFVIPAVTTGIPQAWEIMVNAQAEIAVYASLFMTLYLGMFFGGVNPPYSELNTPGIDHFNPRLRAQFGFYAGMSFGLLNIIIGVLYRFTGSYLPRESDELVVMWAFRWLPLLNFLMFIVGCLAGLIFGMGAGVIALFYGNACTDGSITFLQWYLEWVRESYPIGRGVVLTLSMKPS